MAAPGITQIMGEPANQGLGRYNSGTRFELEPSNPRARDDVRAPSYGLRLVGQGTTPSNFFKSNRGLARSRRFKGTVVEGCAWIQSFLETIRRAISRIRIVCVSAHR